jgi:hypothetical protein
VPTCERDHCATSHADGSASGKRHCDATDHNAIDRIDEAASNASAAKASEPAAATGALAPPRAPAAIHRRPSTRATRSPVIHAASTAITSRNSITAAADAGKYRATSASVNPRIASTASGGGFEGPTTSATSTTDSENATTAKMGSRTWQYTCGAIAFIHADAREYPSERAIAMCASTRTCASAPTIISTRYGTSLTRSATISAMPRGSPTVATSGGTSNPVAHGESSRTIQPEGATTNARPMASAECGVARMGVTAALARRIHGRPCAHAQNEKAIAAAAIGVDDAREQGNRKRRREPGRRDQLAPGREREAVAADCGQVAERRQQGPGEARDDRQQEDGHGDDRRGPEMRQLVYRFSQSAAMRVVQDACGSSSEAPSSALVGSAGDFGNSSNDFRSAGDSFARSSTVKLPVCR